MEAVQPAETEEAELAKQKCCQRVAAVREAAAQSTLYSTLELKQKPRQLAALYLRAPLPGDSEVCWLYSY